MSKNVAMFVDVANLYYSARGQDVDVDYTALLKYATKGRDLIRAYAYSGLDPDNENQRKFIDFLGKNGYKVLTKDIRKFGDGRVKANLDIELVVDLFRLQDRMDIAVIVSGDGDFAPAITALQEVGVRCEVISFRPNTSSDLIAVADEFVDIMKIAGIGRGSKEAKAQRGMSMPEMPAKEVSPEFGFRDASPSVAAAALAALRGGKDGRNGGNGTRSRTGRTRRSAEPASAESAEERPATATVEGEGSGEGRRRRRRRGGRGRGRGRGRSESASTPAEGSSEEIGWTELDDLSQVDDFALSERDPDDDYTFEEADADTLAELGLTADDAADAEEKPKRTPRRTTRTPTKTAAKADDAADAEEKPKRTTRRTTRTTTKTAAKADDAADAEEKPKRTPRRTTRTTTRTAAKADDSADADAEEGAQGIWQRFRSGRPSSR